MPIATQFILSASSRLHHILIVHLLLVTPVVVSITALGTPDVAVRQTIGVSEKLSVNVMSCDVVSPAAHCIETVPCCIFKSDSAKNLSHPVKLLPLYLLRARLPSPVNCTCQNVESDCSGVLIPVKADPPVIRDWKSLFS